MKILQTISDMGVKSGGPTTCTFVLAKGLINLGIRVEILTFASTKNDTLISNDAFIKTVKRPFEIKFGYSKLYNLILKKQKNDIIHANGLWQFTSYCSAKHSFKSKTPFIISPHGMLYPEALQISKNIKKIGFFLYQKSILNKATVIHATSHQEKEHIRLLGIKTPIAVIPNAIELPINDSVKTVNDIKRIGFLGRFSPIKNLEILLKAWAEVGKDISNFELYFIGDGAPEYKAFLIDQAKEFGIKNIVFTGFLKGEERDKMIKSLTCLVLPSKSENFGMVVAEALSFNIPVIASKGTPWKDLSSYNCGWWIDIGVNPLKKALEEVMQTKESVLIIMGENGRKLVEDKYSMEYVATQMLELYNWVLNKRGKPDFVKLN